MLDLLHCNIFYGPTQEAVGVKYTENEKEVPPNCIFIQDAGCAQEAERLLREERQYLMEEGENRFLEIQAAIDEQLGIQPIAEPFQASMAAHSQMLDYGMEGRSGI